MARQQIERADIALLIVDGSLGVTSHDATIASYAKDSGRSLIIVMNKWDLAKEAALKAAADRSKQARPPKLRTVTDPAKLMQDYERIVRAKLKFLDYRSHHFSFRFHRRTRRQSF